MKNTRKIISVLLSILMIVTSVPLMAVESFAATNGTTGDCTWTLDGTVLTISGNGKMRDYNWEEASPWGTSITKVVIENGVTSIGDYACYNCTSLESVTIPDSVTSIGERPFEGCRSLTSVTIGNGVTSIGYFAFRNCTSLTSITIGNSVTSIGKYAFDGCTSLTSITIPDSVTSIGDYNFSGCTSLASVTIGNGVTSIGGWAFSRCTSLTSITIPDSVTSIGEGAFANCTLLASITISDSVTSIGGGAFAKTAYYNNESNWDNGILYIGNHLIKIKNDVFDHVEIKQGTKVIADEAFYSGLFTSVTIPDSVTEIGYEAFCGCRSLKSVTIPDSVTSINDGAFWNCTSFTSITIPNSVTKIGRYVFAGCTSLTSITIGNGVTSIGDSGFSYCKSLTSITIPDSVTEIGIYAFKECFSLTGVTIGNGVTSICEYAFDDCTSLTSITIPDNVTSIGDWAFRNCTSLTSATIGNGVTEIGEKAFYNCALLTSVTIGNSVTSIGDRAFEGCRSLTSVTIPDNVTSIGYSAFEDCTSLTEINVSSNNANYSSENGVLFNKEKTELIKYPAGKTETKYIIPDSVTEIDDWAFENCTSLTSVTIPDSVTEIDDWAFENCTSLTSVTIPDSGTYIRIRAFYGCTSLTSVTIPKSVKDIGSEAFGYYYDSVENKIKTIDGFTVYGYQGSVAEKYAKNNGFEFSPMASTNELLLISVTKMPTKTEYYVGDTLDTTGLEITAKYTDNTEKVIASDLTITGFNSSTAGTKVVTVEYKGKTATFTVEVVKPSITIANNSLSFDSIGSTKSLTATTTPSDQKIVWSSSNKNVATVSDGVVTAKGAGNATITATITVNGIEYSAECAVDVKLPTMSFPDVASGDWYYNAVKFNAEKGYVTGYSNGTFGPSNNIQRQDFVLILARIAGADLSAYEGQNGGFSDVPTNAYYSAAVAWAKDKGIVTGYSADNFGVGTYITREQISLILCRYLGGEASGDVDTILNAYSDGGNTSPWAKAGVAWAVENGIIGNSDYLNPNGNAGRAEVAQIIYNMSNKGML